MAYLVGCRDFLQEALHILALGIAADVTIAVDSITWPEHWTSYKCTYFVSIHRRRKLMDGSIFGHAALGVGFPHKCIFGTDSAFFATPLYLTRYLAPDHHASVNALRDPPGDPPRRASRLSFGHPAKI